MEINAKITLINHEENDNFKAYANVTFDNCFIVRGLKVIRGNKGFFVSMPSKKQKNGIFIDIAHPINNEIRKFIEQKVLEAYEEALKTEK